jgi:TRAP-type uncharacterized transport system substrate-binding protein
LLNVALFWAVFRQIRNKIDALRTETESVINFGEMSLSAFSPAMTAVALLSTLSWSGFIVSGFMLWATGNTNGGYSMVGIAICLPAVIAALLPLFARNSSATSAVVSAPMSPQMTALAFLSVLSWLGFIVAGFMLWATGNTNGGYSMVGIAICLPAVIAAVVAVVHGRSAPAATVSAGAAAPVVDSGVVVNAAVAN